MPSLDTNILVRLCVGDVPSQSAAANSLLAAGDVLEVSDAAIIETSHVLASYYGLDRAELAATLEGLLSQPELNCNRPLFQKVTQYYKAHTQVSFVDCCLAVDAELSAATPLLTFDRALAKKLPGAKLLQT